MLMVLLLCIYLFTIKQTVSIGGLTMTKPKKASRSSFRLHFDSHIMCIFNRDFPSPGLDILEFRSCDKKKSRILDCYIEVATIDVLGEVSQYLSYRANCVTLIYNDLYLHRRVRLNQCVFKPK